MRSLLLLVALLSAAECALAQSSRPDAADPGVPATPPRYESAFAEYQPFLEQKSSWKQVNQEAGVSPAMDSMQHNPGMSMPGMDSNTGDAPKGKGGAAGQDMGSMKDMPGMDKPAATAPKGNGGAAGHDMGAMKDMLGMNKSAATAPKGKAGTAGHDLSSMKDMPGMDRPAATAPMSKETHEAMAMGTPQTDSHQHSNAQAASVAGTGLVQSIDKVNGKIKITHDPIAAMGWPKMTLFFRLKESSLADQVKEGDKVEFSLEKSASGYVISDLQKSSPEADFGHKK